MIWSTRLAVDLSAYVARIAAPLGSVIPMFSGEPDTDRVGSGEFSKPFTASNKFMCLRAIRRIDLLPNDRGSTREASTFHDSLTRLAASVAHTPSVLS